MNDTSILIVGDIMLDKYSIGRTSRISPEAPVPVLLENPENISYKPGGAANTAVNVVAAGVDKVSLLSVCGNDENGKILLQLLCDFGVDTLRIYCDNRPTIVKHRYIAQNNQQILRVDRETADEMDAKLRHKILNGLKEYIREYDLILLSDYDKGFLEKEIAQSIICLAKESGVPVFIDVKGNQLDKYRGAALLKPNREELQGLTGKKLLTEKDISDAARNLCYAADCKYVLVTLGADGMMLVTHSEIILRIKSVAQEVYDVTGAGDTSLAYLAAGLAQGKDIIEAVKIANYAAAVQVSKVGTGIVCPQEVRDMMYGRKGGNFNKELSFYKEKGMETVEKERAEGKKLVFTNGCFDILHVGHIKYLKEAKAMGDCLIVGVNSDASVKRLKGQARPVNTLGDRLALLSALEFVDYVVAFEEDTPEELIGAVKPDVLVKGGDYRMEEIVGADYVLGYGGTVTTIPLVEGKSTTGMIEKMKR